MIDKIFSDIESKLKELQNILISHPPKLDPVPLTPSPKPDPVPPTLSPSYHCLVLVIGATKANILKFIKEGYSPNHDLCEELYQSTKFLWFGSENQCSSRFDGLFTDREGNYAGDSEYDVYFVKVLLKNYNESGFNSGISSIKRIDAFRQLTHVGKVIAISKRLPASSYQHRNLYER